MLATVYFNEGRIQRIEGDTVKELIEDNFNIFKKTISDKAGNPAGFTLEKAWISRVDDEICEFHVIAHGSDSLINYDATQEFSKEVMFKITGIPKDALEDTYEFEIEEKIFNPFDSKWHNDKSFIVGILEGCVDQLAKQDIAAVNKYGTPKELVDRAYPYLKDNNLPVYITQLMTRFTTLYSVKKTKNNEDIFLLIDKLNNALVPLIEKDKSRIGATESLLYYKTKYYFSHRNKITALKFYRNASGKTQEEVAEAVGISLRQYQRYEASNSTLGDAKKAVISAIAKEIGVEADDIVSYGIVKLRQEK